MKKITLFILSFIVGIVSTYAQCTTSSPIVVTSNGQVIENVKISATTSNAITINGFSNVIIRNCEIEYTGAFQGIKFSNADGLRVENTSVIYTNPPAAGPLPSANSNCLEGFMSQNIVISNVRMEDGSSGIRLNQCDNAMMSFIEGYNFRGPLPRGQLVQFDKCVGGTLQDFYNFNDPVISWPEDNISMFESGGQTIQRGLIDGNNSTNGIGVLFEDQSEADARGGLGGTVKNVDIINIGNGACSSVDGAGNVTFENIRVKGLICTDQGRGLPASGALAFSGKGTEDGAGGNKILNSLVYQSCKGTQVVFPLDKFDTIEIDVNTDFRTRTPIKAILATCNTLNVNDNITLSDFVDVFPNPVANELTVSFTNGTIKGEQLAIIDLTGNTIREFSLTNNLQNINVTDLAEGVYFVQITTDKGVFNRKIIKR